MQRGSLLYGGLFLGSIVMGGIVVAVGPRLGLAIGIAPWLVAFAVSRPRLISLVAVPVFLLLPPTIRVPLSVVPELTPLRILIFLAVVGWALRERTENTSSLPAAYVILGTVFVLYVVGDAVPHGTSSLNRGLDYSLEGLLTAWAASRAIRDKRDLLNLVDLLIGVITVAAALGLLEVVTNHYLIAAQEPFFFHAPARDGSLRAQGIFPHPLVYGAALAVMLPVAIVRGLTTTGRRRLLAGVACCFIALGILAGSERGPWAGALVAVVILMLFLHGKRRLAIVGVVTLAAVALALSPEGGKVGTLVSGVFNPRGSGETAGYTVEYREKLLAASTAFAESHPFGTGPGLAHELDFLAIVGGNRTNLAESIDNAYAKYAVEIGPVGLALFLLWLGSVLLAAWRARRHPDDELASLATAILAGEVAMLVTSTTVATFSWAQLAAIFWILVGITMAIGSLRYQSEPLIGRRLLLRTAW
jgi:O-Antigen ligase